MCLTAFTGWFSFVLGLPCKVTAPLPLHIIVVKRCVLPLFISGPMLYAFYSLVFPLHRVTACWEHILGTLVPPSACLSTSVSAFLCTPCACRYIGHHLFASYLFGVLTTFLGGERSLFLVHVCIACNTLSPVQTCPSYQMPISLFTARANLLSVCISLVIQIS